MTQAALAFVNNDHEPASLHEDYLQKHAKALVDELHVPDLE